MLQRAQGVASTPYQAYTGELTAPTNSQQNTGIGNINQNANFAQPAVNQALGIAGGAANPLTAAQIQQYQNPYTQNVVDATQAQFNRSNAQGQAALKGNTIASGALGGNREGVAQANLASQQASAQNPIIAQQYANAYQSGLGTAAQQFQQNPLAAAGSLANFGISGQGAALSGAGAQLGAGTLQQQTQQAQDTANYGQYAQGQAFPYQQTQWLAGIDTGVGSNLGGTSTGTTTGPPPNPWAQLLGTGVAAASQFLNSGGRVHGYAGGGVVPHMADGGVPNTPWANGVGWIPSMNVHGGSGAPQARAPSPANTSISFDPTKFAQGLSGLSNKLSGPAYGGGNIFTDAYGGSSSSPLEGLTAADYGEGYRRGGVVGSADGGAPAIDYTDPSWNAPDYGPGIGSAFADRFAPAVDNPLGQMTRGQGIALAGKNGTVAPSSIPGGEPASSGATYDDGQGDFRLTGTRPTGDPDAMKGTGIAAAAPGSPPVVAKDDGDDETPSAATPTSGHGIAAAGQFVPPYAVDVPSGAVPSRDDRGGLLGLSQNARTGLLAAGLGLLSSRSPNLGNAIGDAGMAGLSAYGAANTQDKKEAMDAQKLSAEAKAAANKLAEETFKTNEASAQQSLVQDADGNWIPNKAKLDYAKQNADITAKDNWTLIPGDGDHPDRLVNHATGVVKDVPAGQGAVVLGALQAGQFDYRKDAPHVQKGDTVPEPVTTSGHSADALKSDAEYYLATGVLPKASVSPRNPMGQQQVQYQRAVQNYGTALALSKGQTPESFADIRRFGLKAASFPLSRQGDQTVAIGTAIRHLGALEEYAKAWDASKGNVNAPILRQAAARFATFLGKEEPTNLEQAARIAGPEVIKAIGVAGAGTGGERFEQEKGFQPGASTQQILGSADVARKFLAGQLPAKEAQARNVGFPHERFMDMVGPQEYDYLSAINHGKPAESGGGGSAPPPDAVGKMKDQSGKYWYVDKNNKPLGQVQ